MHLPTNTSGVDDTTVYINQASATSLKASYDLHNGATTIIADTTTLNTTITASYTSNTLILSNIDIGGNYGGNFAFYNDAGAAPDQMYLPRVASNTATRYESWVIATIGEINYVKF